jgi:hypothetical protein
VSPLYLAPPLDSSSQSFWAQANSDVLWGWKRDKDRHSRIVYYSAKIIQTPKGIAATNHFFFYKHRTVETDAEYLYGQLQNGYSQLSNLIGECQMSLSSTKYPGYSVVRFTAGRPTDEDRDRVRRLQTRKPRKALGNMGDPIPNAIPSDTIPLLPFDLYLGSGVSYEAGLPTLCDIHDYFCLDDREHGRFTYGKRDLLPLWLMEKPSETFRDFCHLHVKSLTASPTPAQKIVKELHQSGQVITVFSDNVDNMLCKVDVPFIRTRGSGVFNERFPAKFAAKTLVVVGVAADRRQIIQQARGKGIKVVVVNPCHTVSPHVQHLNYIKQRDLFLKLTAHQFFTELKLSLLIASPGKSKVEAYLQGDI